MRKKECGGGFGVVVVVHCVHDVYIDLVEVGWTFKPFKSFKNI